MPLLLFYLISPSFGLYEDLSMVVCQFVTGMAALFEKKTGLTFITPPDFAGEPYPLPPSCDLYITKTSPKFLWNSFAVRTGFFSVHTNGGNYPQIRIQNGYITISLLLF